MAKMNIVCHIIDKKNKDKKGFMCFCKPPEDNPYLIIERQGPSETSKINWVRVYESDVEEDCLDPHFKKISINLFHLCNGNKNMNLRFSLFTKTDSGKSLLYGHSEISPKEIEDKISKKVERELINERAKPKVAGTIQFLEF